MAEYYLVSQLPSLDGLGENAPLPITQERFTELCGRLFDKKSLGELENLTLVPPIDGDFADNDFIGLWNSGERKLRLALAKVRADKLGKAFDLKNETVSSDHIKTANAALDIENPMKAELFLLNYRLDFLETLRPMDSFSKEYVYYYALKLKLLSRIREFDSKAGQATYKNIYSSVLRGAESEEKQ